MFMMFLVEEYCSMFVGSKLKNKMISFVNFSSLYPNSFTLSNDKFSPCWTTSGMNNDMKPKSTPTNTKREVLAASKLLNLSLFLRNNAMGRPIKEIIAATTR